MTFLRNIIFLKGQLTRNCGRPSAVIFMAENPSAEAPPANCWQFMSLFTAAPKPGAYFVFHSPEILT